jgi:hypothetical protein
MRVRAHTLTLRVAQPKDPYPREAVDWGWHLNVCFEAAAAIL